MLCVYYREETESRHHNGYDDENALRVGRVRILRKKKFLNNK